MHKVLGGQPSSHNDDDTMAGGQSLEGATFNQRSIKEQRTFQDPRGDKILGAQHSSF